VKILITYYTRTGNTRKMAELVAKGAKEEGAEVTIKTVDNVLPDELVQYDALIFGTPTYYGQMAYPVKKLIDDSVILHGKLEGKVGAAFTSSANIGGGNETAIISILQAFLIHGMIIQGTSKHDHYGPVAIGAPDNRSEKQCIALGKRIVKLTNKTLQK